MTYSFQVPLTGGGTIDVDGEELAWLVKQRLVYVEIGTTTIGDRGQILKELANRSWEKPKTRPRANADTGRQRRKAAQPTNGAARKSPAKESRDQAMLRIVRERKNVTVKQIADELGLKDATSLYRVQKRLVAQGHLVKTGRTLALRID